MAKKPRNYKANEATFINIDPLKRRVNTLEIEVDSQDNRIRNLEAELRRLRKAFDIIETKLTKVAFNDHS